MGPINITLGLDKALVALDKQGGVPSVQVYKQLLQACMQSRALEDAKQVHDHLVKHGLESDTGLGDLVVTTLVKCGSFADGLHLFRRLPSRTVFSWTAIISGYSNAGRCREALLCYQHMREEDVQPNKYTFVSLLKACSRLEDLEEGKRMHAAVVSYGLEVDVYVGNTLVSMYAKCKSIPDAQQVFDGLSQRDVVSWNALVAAYAQQGHGKQALRLYAQMEEEGVKSNARTFVSVLQACGILAEKEGFLVVGTQNVKLETLQKGKQVHTGAAARGFESDVFVGNSLVSMYAKCGSIVDAEFMFCRLSQPDVVSWNALLGPLSQLGQGGKVLQLYSQMQEEEVMPDELTFISLLQACSSLAEQEEEAVMDGQGVKIESLAKGKEIHAGAAGMGFGTDVFVVNTLVNFYAKCGSIKDAVQVFNRLSRRDVVSWTAMIASYSQKEQGEKALQLFWHMQEEGIRPNAHTFVSTLQACGSLAEQEQSAPVDKLLVKLQSLQKGKEVHHEAVRSGFGSDMFVGSSLVSMYAKCGSTVDARQVFDRLYEHDVVSWTAMIAAYAHEGQGEEALQIYQQMKAAGVRPNAWTFVSLVQACGSLADKEEELFVEGQHVKVKSLGQGKEIHAVGHGFASDVFVGTSLVSLYAKCGSIKDAEKVFHALPQHDVVSCTAMIAAYAEREQGEKALQLYDKMQAAGMKPNEATIVSVLEACGTTGALDICVHIHRSILGTGLECSACVATSLIHAYGKCGSMVDAESVFHSLAQPNVVSWTALIAGYARVGCCERSIQCYNNMLLAGVNPDRITFLALLMACSHAGKVEKGLHYFHSMPSDHGIVPELEHYGCVVDLVCRAGLLDKVEELLLQMPMQPDLSLWLSVLGACHKHGNIPLGQRAFDEAVALEPKQASAYVLMSNMFADAGVLGHGKHIHDLRLAAGAWKEPGQSWIEHESQVHTFAVGDHWHGQDAILCELLKELSAGIT